MRFLEFREKFSSFNAITHQDVENVFGNVNQSQFLTWKKEGKLIALKRGVYALGESAIDVMLLANEMNDSYISLEFALSYHQMIPEAAMTITSVSKKTKEEIANAFGSFLYSKIAPKLFCGFVLVESVRHPGRNIRIAEKEKALFDLVYFRSDLKEKKDFDSLRLHLEGVRVSRIRQFVSLVNAAQLRKRLDNFVEYLDDLV